MLSAAWSEAEDASLLAAVVRYGHAHWAVVAAQVGGGRTSAGCCERYEALQQPGLADVPELLSMLGQGCDAALDEAVLGHLCELCDRSTGDAGAQFGAFVRESGALPRLIMQLCATETSVELALRLLANLASDAFDPNSAATKRLCWRASLAGPLLRCMSSNDEGILTYACATVQNLCFDREWAALLYRHGVKERLEQLLLSRGDSVYVVRYASGALHNMLTLASDSDVEAAMSEDALHAIHERRIALLRERAAARRMQRWARARRAASRPKSPPLIAVPDAGERTTACPRRALAAAGPPRILKDGAADTGADSDSESVISEASTAIAPSAHSPLVRVGLLLSSWVGGSSPAGAKGRSVVHPLTRPSSVLMDDTFV